MKNFLFFISHLLFVSSIFYFVFLYHIQFFYIITLFYVVYFNMIYLPDYLNFYLNLNLLCILSFYPTLLFFIKYFLLHIFKVCFRGVTRYYHFHIENQFSKIPMDYTSSSQVSYPVFFSSKILSFVSLFFLFCFCNCIIAPLFIFDNTFSENFASFVNFDTLHTFCQSLCIVYSEYFDYYFF